MAENNFSTIKADIKSAASYIKDMADAVKDVDAAMTELYKVTDETDKRYEQFLSDAGRNAKELGRSVSSLVAQTAEWSKLGWPKSCQRQAPSMQTSAVKTMLMLSLILPWL